MGTWYCTGVSAEAADSYVRRRAEWRFKSLRSPSAKYSSGESRLLESSGLRGRVRAGVGTGAVSTSRWDTVAGGGRCAGVGGAVVGGGTASFRARSRGFQCVMSRLSASVGVIGAVAAPSEIEIGTPAPSAEVLDLVLASIATPAGRLVLLGQVPTLEPFRALPPDVRLWMRWAEPEETGLESARIELATSTQHDERAGTARSSGSGGRVQGCRNPEARRSAARWTCVTERATAGDHVLTRVRRSLPALRPIRVVRRPVSERLPVGTWPARACAKSVSIALEASGWRPIARSPPFSQSVLAHKGVSERRALRGAAAAEAASMGIVRGRWDSGGRLPSSESCRFGDFEVTRAIFS